MQKSEKRKQQQDLTQGVIWKQVLIFFLPLVIGAFFQHLYTIIDTMIVGKALGTRELSAVGGSASKLIVMYTNFFIGVSSGITAYVSRSFGEKNYEKLRNVIFNGTVFFLVLGFVLSLCGIFFSGTYFSLMNTPVETLDYARTYLHTYLGGIIFCVLYNTFSGILRALGDSVRPLYALVFCSFVNISLDVFFTFGLKLGVFGIALATVIAQGTSAVILAVILWKEMKEFQETQDTKVVLNFSLMKEMGKIGIPAGLQSMMYSLSNMVVQSAVNGFGEVSVAAWTAYVKLDGIADIFLSSLGGTVIPFVGQNLGAKQVGRVKTAVLQIVGISYGILSCVAIFFLINREILLSIFTYDTEVIAIGSQLMWVILPMHLLAIPQQMCSQALRGLGVSFVPMILTLVGVVGLRLCWVAVVLPFNPSLMLLGACYPASAFLMSCIFSVYYGIEIKKVKV